MSFIRQLIDTVRNEKFVYIQPHNFPDHDAVASAFALQILLEEFDISSRLVYEGEIQRDSLKELIRNLKIDIRHISEYQMTAEEKIIVVDGCKGNKNVTDLIGDEIAVIDHHQVTKPDDVPLCDIRQEYGSCSTIICSYFEELNLEIPQRAATALIVGIDMDTALFTRDAALEDVSSYAKLYTRGDIRLVNTILRNYIQLKDLKFYKKVIENVSVTGEFAYCYFPEGCNQNLLGILGDFLLALQEIDFVVLAADNGGRINLSVRNEREEWNAALVVQNVLKDIGFGGGHADMAGGIIRQFDSYKKLDLEQKFISELGV